MPEVALRALMQSIFKQEYSPIWRSAMLEEEWQRRYSAARSLLDDPMTMAALGRAELELHRSTAADVRVLAGADLLRGAQRLGLLSGSFNPLTSAHVAL